MHEVFPTFECIFEKILNISGHVLVEIMEKLRGQRSGTGHGPGPTLHVVPLKLYESVKMSNLHSSQEQLQILSLLDQFGVFGIYYFRISIITMENSRIRITFWNSLHGSSFQSTVDSCGIYSVCF